MAILKVALIAISISTMALAAAAEPETRDLFVVGDELLVFDPASGLEWLDLEATRNRSAQEDNCCNLPDLGFRRAVEGTDSGGEFRTEISDFWRSVGVANVGPAGGGFIDTPGNCPGVPEAIGWLGETNPGYNYGIYVDHQAPTNTRYAHLDSRNGMCLAAILCCAPNQGLHTSFRAFDVALYLVRDSSEPDCSDGYDNEGDELVDYPDDPGCSGPSDDSERAISLPCDDGFDNNGDGTSDYRGSSDFMHAEDPLCLSPTTKPGEGPTPRRCGLGWEMVFVAPIVRAIQCRTRRRGMPL